MGWHDVQYRREDQESPAIAAFCESVRKTHVNGGVILARFVATDAAEFDRAVRVDVGGPLRRFGIFLNSPSVKAALPELKIGEPSPEDLEFRFALPFGAEDELAHLLLAGGAYVKFSGTVDEARAICARFVDAMFQERVLETWGAATQKAWAPWFYDVAWDTTYIFCDPAKKCFWLLCITDTD